MARLLLLACTLLGLAAMHTIGHGLMVGHSSHTAHTQTTMAVASLTGHDGCAGDGCTSMTALADRTGGHGMSPWELCVAILTAFTVAVLLAVLLLRARTGRSPAPGSESGHARTPRAPPLLLMGLTLARVSVQRI